MKGLVLDASDQETRIQPIMFAPPPPRRTCLQIGLKPKTKQDAAIFFEGVPVQAPQ